MSHNKCIRSKVIFSDLDSIGRGRLPWMIKPAAIIVITDGGKLTSSNQLKPELIIPGSTLPGSSTKPYPTQPIPTDSPQELTVGE